MNEILQAGDIIRGAEAEVRKLLVSSAGGGDYETIAKLVELARQLRRLAEQIEIGNGRVPRTAAGESHETSDGVLSSSVVVPPTQSATSDGRPSRADTKRRKKKAKSLYPRFYRDRDELVKIGWSKKQKAEYRHKAPWEVVLTVARALREKGSIGEKFSFDELLPIRTASGSEVPSYQAYLVLAWLRKENLIVQHGRQGYSLQPNINLMDALEERWKLLPKA